MLLCAMLAISTLWCARCPRLVGSIRTWLEDLRSKQSSVSTKMRTMARPLRATIHNSITDPIGAVSGGGGLLLPAVSVADSEVSVGGGGEGDGGERAHGLTQVYGGGGDGDGGGGIVVESVLGPQSSQSVPR